MSKKLVDEDEWEALCELRDGEHEKLRLFSAKLEDNYRSALNLCAQRRHDLDKSDIVIAFLRDENIKQHKLILEMQKRLQELEPVKTSIPQPAFRK